MRKKNEDDIINKDYQIQKKEYKDQLEKYFRLNSFEELLAFAEENGFLSEKAKSKMTLGGINISNAKARKILVNTDISEFDFERLGLNEKKRHSKLKTKFSVLEKTYIIEYIHRNKGSI